MPDGSRRRVARTAPDTRGQRPGPGIRARSFPTCAPRDCRPSEFAPSGLSPFRVRALGPVDPPGSCIALPAPSRPIAPLASPRPNAAPLPLIWMRMPFCTQKARPLPHSSSQAPRLPGLLSTPDFRPRTTCVQNGFFVQLGPDSAQHTARRREPPISHARSQGTPHCTPAHALPAVAEQALQQSRRKAPLAVGRHCPTRFDRRTARPKRRHQIRAWL